MTRIQLGLFTVAYSPVAAGSRGANRLERRSSAAAGQSSSFDSRAASEETVRVCRYPERAPRKKER
jgi:hypothetical protein